MPNKNEHINQAKHNDLYWNHLNSQSTPFLDWTIVGLFYEAVHWVEAFLATKEEHSANHDQRLSAIHSHAELRSLYSPFRLLKDDSEAARYRCFKHSQSQVQTDMVPRIYTIRRLIQQLI